MEAIDKEISNELNWKLQGEFVLNSDLRAQALQSFQNTAFPTTRNEAWKYTRVSKIKNAHFNIQEQTIDLSGDFSIVPNSLQVVFVNGHYSQNLSSKSFPEGVKVEALSKMDPRELATFGNAISTENEVFTALNTAYATDGVYIHVTAKMQIEPTLEIIQINTNQNILSNVRNILVVEQFAEINLVHRNISVAGTNNFSNTISEITVGANAKVNIDKIQEEDESCFQINTEFVHQEKDSNFTINTITLNGGLIRNNLNININGVNCETHLNGAYILKGNQHVDNHTVVDHKVSHCESNELYKGVIDDKATAVFNGKVFVRKDAQKINAYQSNANVLLSENASVNSKPELEIYADDVKCSHGSTTGQLNEEAIFYLRARGLSESSARQLLVGAFIEDVLQKIENKNVVEYIHLAIKDRFNWVLE